MTGIIEPRRSSSLLRAMRSARSGLASKATARLRSGAGTIRPRPNRAGADIPEQLGPPRGAGAQMVIARISDLVICPSWANHSPSSPARQRQDARVAWPTTSTAIRLSGIDAVRGAEGGGLRSRGCSPAPADRLHHGDAGARAEAARRQHFGDGAAARWSRPRHRRGHAPGCRWHDALERARHAARPARIPPAASASGCRQASRRRRSAG